MKVLTKLLFIISWLRILITPSFVRPARFHVAYRSVVCSIQYPAKPAAPPILWPTVSSIYITNYCQVHSLGMLRVLNLSFFCVLHILSPVATQQVHCTSLSIMSDIGEVLYMSFLFVRCFCSCTDTIVSKCLPWRSAVSHVHMYGWSRSNPMDTGKPPAVLVTIDNKQFTWREFITLIILCMHTCRLEIHR